MRKRSKSREIVLKVLYQAEVTHQTLIASWQSYQEYQDTFDSDVRLFAHRIIDGISANQDDLDALIAKAANNWQLKRMAYIDRNILRIGAYELMFALDIPPKVSINEAVELAKKYGDNESSKFVNGILDRVHKDYAEKKITRS
jgi:N utilization substance protein B